MANLKKEEWSINVLGKTGMSAETDIAFGVTEDDKPALRLGDNIITKSGGGGGGGSWADITDKPFDTVGSNMNVTGGALTARPHWDDIQSKPFTNIDGAGLKIEGNKLKLDTTDNASAAEERPITAKGVYEIVGNVAYLLAGI